MSDIAIKVENLCKSYLVGHKVKQREHYPVLRDVIAHNAKNLLRKTFDMFNGRPIVQGDETEEFWALTDINFEIKHGERVGIIGRNGAGKSTLLKILSRITDPTSGRITINGRVASLLEVGTGFHPELTGRENIFLNGAILGMTKAEIMRKFDEIVAFAEVERFLDTPVKRYSSGMYVRLAFAVAAHLQPDILIIDEVLAVGDFEFQKKCLGKMSESGHEGRTILFVSHNINALRMLCPNAILLKDGRVYRNGRSDDVIATYLEQGTGAGLEKSWHPASAPGNSSVKLTSARIYQVDVGAQAILDGNRDIYIELKLMVLKACRDFAVGVRMESIDGCIVLHTSSIVAKEDFKPTIGTNTLILIIPGGLLNFGCYRLTLGADVPNVEILFEAEGILTWEVACQGQSFGRYGHGAWKGYINPDRVHWQFSYEKNSF